MKNPINRGAKLIVSMITVGVLLLTPLNVGHAQVGDALLSCTYGALTFDIRKCLYATSQIKFPSLDMQRTVETILNHMVHGFGSSFVLGPNLSDAQNCAEKDLDGLKGTPSDYSLAEPYCNFGIFVKAPGTEAAYSGAGSLASIAGFTGQLSTGSVNPVPTNLALFFRHQVKDVPYVGDTVYAQATYNIPGGAFILGIWEDFRNLAFGILAISMVIIGIMIMLRKKINPQTIVTVQNALPRVVIGAVLILFSYPIGALGASLIGPLSIVVIRFLVSLQCPDGIVGSCMEDIFKTSGGDLIGPGIVSIVTLVSVFFLVRIISSIPIGLGIIAILLILIAVYFVVLIIAFLRMIIVYLRILTMIVFAPVRFAIGVIPGNEHMITDWFKLLAARVLTIPAMFGTLGFTVFLLLNAVAINPTDPSGFTSVEGAVSYLGAAADTILVLLFFPFIALYVAVIAIKMPKKVEEAIVGKKRR